MKRRDREMKRRAAQRCRTHEKRRQRRAPKGSPLHFKIVDESTRKLFFGDIIGKLTGSFGDVWK